LQLDNVYKVWFWQDYFTHLYGDGGAGVFILDCMV